MISSDVSLGLSRRESEGKSRRRLSPTTVFIHISLSLHLCAGRWARRRFRAAVDFTAVRIPCRRSTAAPTNREERLSLLSRPHLSRPNDGQACHRRRTTAPRRHARLRRNSPTRRLGQGRPGCGHIGRSGLESGRGRPQHVAPSWSTVRTRLLRVLSSRRCSRAFLFLVCRFPRAAREVGPGCRHGCRWCRRRQLSTRPPWFAPVVPTLSAMKSPTARRPLLLSQHRPMWWSVSLTGSEAPRTA